MHTLKPFGSTGRFRPWCSVRHRSRYGLMETLRREFGGDPTTPQSAEAVEELSPMARRDLRDRCDGVSA